MKKHLYSVLSHLTVVALVLGATPVRAALSYLVGSLDLSNIEQGWGEPQRDRSVERHLLAIGGQIFTNGLGTHAESKCAILVNGAADSFSAKVGVDDEVGGGRGSVVFKVVGDCRTLWQSQLLHQGEAPEAVEVKLDGVQKPELLVEDGGDGIDDDHADWAAAQLTMREGKPLPLPAIKEEAVILTPKPSPKPAIHGAKVFGVRPGAPFLFTIAATGDRPMTFGATGLPKGLSLDNNSGRITGALAKEGKFPVTLRAKNKLGVAERQLKIVCGPRIGLTPAMGWNSWYCFAGSVSADKIKAAADAMVASGLINHGWTYINIDDYWQVHRDSQDPTLQGPQRDAQGRILPNPRFPDMKALTDYVHGRGLKIGLYSSPGPWTCGGCVGSFDHEQLDAQSYADWGFDYFKYDWCSYTPALEAQRGNSTNDFKKLKLWPPDVPNELAEMIKPYALMRAALDKVPRDIIYNFCQYGMGNVWEWGDRIGGNSWRTTRDITDTWKAMSGIGFNQNGHEKFAGPGHFNDLDMLIVGKVGFGNLRPTRLTPNEQYTHISLWCLLASPLLISGDMTQFDDFTLSLLSNDEVLDVNQDPLGRQAARVAKRGDLEVWAKDMEDGSKAVGLFNRGKLEAPVSVNWADLGLTVKQKVRDLWRQKDLGDFADAFAAKVPRHGAVLVRLWPAK